VLDGEEHVRERRLIQTPFHGERMRSLQPLVAKLAREELGVPESARRSALVVTPHRGAEVLVQDPSSSASSAAS
jgi:cytochrome P450